MSSPLSRSILAALVAIAFAAPAAAGTVSGPSAGEVIVNIVETAAGVDVSFSGQLGLAGLTRLATNFALGAGILAGQGALSFGSPTDFYSGPFTPTPFGAGGLASPSSRSGVFAMIRDGGDATQNAVLVPVGYVAGTFISGSMSFDGSTFASLGVTPGQFVTTLSSSYDSDRVIVIATPIPEPGTYALMLAGLGVVGFMARRRRGPAVGA